MEIRLVESEEAAAYRDLRMESLLNSPHAFSTSYTEIKENTVETFESTLAAESTYTFGAYENDQLIGVVHLVRNTKKKLDHRANLNALYVTPYKRGRGYGKKLMRTAIEYAQTLDGVEQVCISVVDLNHTEKRFYYAAGFIPIGIHKRAIKLDDRYYDEELMILMLDNGLM